MKKRIAVILDPEKIEEQTEILAETIIGVSQAFKKLQNSPLTEEAICLLIHRKLPVMSFQQKKVCGLPAIRQVMAVGAKLADYYIKKPRKK